MSRTETPPPVHRILVVDDSPAIHDDFRKVLAHEASDPAEQLAAQIFGDDPQPPAGDR